MIDDFRCAWWKIQIEISEWTKYDISINKCKNDIITEYSSHFGSTDNYYSFAKNGNYGLIDNSSVTQFAHKKFKSELKTSQAGINTSMMDRFSANELEKGVLI